MRSRLTDSVETALKTGEGFLIINDISKDTGSGPVLFGTPVLPGTRHQPAGN